MTRRVTSWALIAHHLRSHAGGGAIVAVLAFTLALLATAGPLAFGALGDAALRDRLGTLSAAERDVIADAPGLPQLPRAIGAEPGTTQQVWGAVDAAIEDTREEADAPLPTILGAGRTVTLSSDNALLEASRTQAVTVAFSPRYEDEVRVVEGRLPEPSGAFLADRVYEDGAPLNRVEVVLSASTAEDLAWPVGEARTTGFATTPVEVVLVGVLAPVDADADFWQHVPSVLTPKVFDDGNAPRLVTGTAFAHPASLVSQGLLGTYSTHVWYPTDVDAIGVAAAPDQVAASLRKFTAVSHTVAASAGGVGILGLRFDADVTGEIDLALAQEASTAGVIAMVVAGPIGVAAAVMLLACRLILERRRTSLRLLSGRGASIGLLRSVLAVEGVIFGTLPAIAGAVVVAAVAVGAGGGPIGGASAVPALVVGLTPVVVLALLAPAAAERQGRADLGRARRGPRLLVEGVIGGLAVLALVLLFARGYSAGADPLLVAAPLLLSLVACLITLRVYPVPLRLLFARARRGAGLDAFLGSARALREPAIGLTPVLALVVGVSVAVSSGILLSALQSGVDDAARAQIGADARITGGAFTRDQLDRVGDLEGVAAASGISGAEPATIDVAGSKRGTSVFVVDGAALRAVQGDGPGMLPPGASVAPLRRPTSEDGRNDAVPPDDPYPLRLAVPHIRGSLVVWQSYAGCWRGRRSSHSSCPQDAVALGGSP